MPRRRQYGPIIPPGRDHDPEGTESLIEKASREWRRRLRQAKDEYIAGLERIPSQEVIVNASRYVYELWPGQIEDLGQLLDQILLEAGPEDPWLWNNYVEQSFERGTARAVKNLSRQSPAYEATRGTLKQVLSEPAYQRRVILVRARVFEGMRGISTDAKSNMARILADGMARGKNPRVIAEMLTKGIKLAYPRAERIARTEINTALRRARWDEGEEADRTLNLKTREVHISALSSTTRDHHAARHGRLFTRDQVRDWFAEGVNSINCKCTTVTVMVDEKGEPLVPSTVERLVAQREIYEQEKLREEEEEKAGR